MGLSDFHIQQLQKAVATEWLTDSKGNQYCTRQLYVPPEIDLPKPDVITVNSLTGLVDFIKDELPSQTMNGIEAKVVIASATTVNVITRPYGPSQQRDTLLTATVEGLYERFPFGQFLEHERFMIAMQALFVSGTNDKENVLNIIGNIKKQDERQSIDNGVSQSVIAKTGIALVEEVRVPNPVTLRPYRTFHEIDQPASEFILRLRASANMPQVALFEADGGFWKNEAIQDIKSWIADKVTIPILA